MRICRAFPVVATLLALAAGTGLRAQSNYAAPYSFSTLAGSPASGGNADGTGGAARFYSPRGVAVDSVSNVYVADTYNNSIRKITPSGVVTTFVGGSGTAGSADGEGTAAQFNEPTDVAVDPAGNVYVADNNNHTIRKITPAGTVTTLAGSPVAPGSTDGTGSAARFNSPSGLTVDTGGNVLWLTLATPPSGKLPPTGT